MSTNIAVVGAGQIGAPLVARLAENKHRVTWISRSTPRRVPQGVVFRAADVRDADALATALGDADVMIAAVNPSVYDAKVWAATLPPMHRGLIGAAQKKNIRVVLLEGLYHYALDAGPLSPQTPRRPASEKGRIRQRVVEMWEKSGVRLTILCASDFWGPGLSAALVTDGGIEAIKRSKSTFVIGHPDVPHAFSHVHDVVEALMNLASTDDVVGDTFHAPVTHMTPRMLVATAAQTVAAQGKVVALPRWVLRLVGMFDKNLGGMVEMLPQWTQPYRVDDALYRRRFGVVARGQW